jgi:signal transduction histidine kinase
VRRRLLLVLLAFSMLAVTAFAWPLLISTASERTQRFLLTRTADLDRIADVAQQAVLEKDEAELRAEVRAYHDLYADGMVVVDTNGVPLAAEGLSMRDPGVSAAVAAALRNQPAALPDDLRPWSDDDVLLAVPIGTDTRVSGAVVLRSSVAATAADIGRAWFLILGAAFLAAVVCVLLALLLARWVLRPLRELERGVLAVAAGRRDAHIGEHHGPRELRALAGSFNRMSDAVAEAAEQQSRLIEDASHELRSPIGRLRLTVDSLARDVSPEQEAGHDLIRTEVAELESLFGSLLDLAAADRTATELAVGTGAGDSCDATELLVERAETWLPTADRAGVRLSAPESVCPVPLALPETELKQVLDVAIDNAIKYAGRGAHVRLECEAGAGHGRVAIADDGPGLPEPDRAVATTRFWRATRDHARTGSGLGLAIAERLVTARGGTLSVLANQPRGLVVELTVPLTDPLDEDSPARPAEEALR